MKKISLALIAPLALSACLAQEATTANEPEADMCGAAELQHLVGQPQAVLKDMTFPDDTRILTPTTPMTMDFRPDRLNILIDEDGMIERVHCV